MKSSAKLLALLFITILSIGIWSCSDDDEPVSITETAQNDSDLTSLVAALTRANLVDALNGTGPFTVFAPSNAAFDAFLTANGFNSLDDVPVDLLTRVLQNHVISGDNRSTDLSTGYLKTISQSTVDSDSNISMYINTSSGVKLNGGTDVTTPDIEATNGVIHKVNSVIGIPSLVDFAVANPDFSSLVAALTRSDLNIDFASVLSGDGPFTVFAPNNAAFADLLTELGVASLNDIPASTLEAVLQYHVLNGANVKAADLTDGQNVITLQGESFTVNVQNGASITDALGRTSNIILTNVQGSNGIVHAIDKVIRPN